MKSPAIFPLVSAACTARHLIVGLIFTLLFLASGLTAWAHNPGLSIATATLDGTNLTIELAMARADAEQIASVDSAVSDQSEKNISAGTVANLQKKVSSSYEVTSGNVPLSLKNAMVAPDTNNGVVMEVNFSGVGAGVLNLRSTWLSDLARGHRQYFTMHDAAGHLLCEQMLDSSRDAISVPISGPDVKPVVQHSFREFLSLGVMHIATGYDHQLFLLGLLLVGGTLRSALKIITSFTIAHSITLALTALKVIHLPSALVEPMIAASIVYVGFENLLRRNTDKRWMLTFCFGLIHGCGFASALQDLGVGDNGTPILLPLVSFNLGVEIGQLAIAAIVLPIIWQCQSSPRFIRRWVPIGSTVIALMGGFWLLQRILF